MQAGDLAVLTLPWPGGWPGAGARGSGGGGRGGGGAWERRLSWRLEAFASGAGLSWSRRPPEPPRLPSGPAVAGTRAVGARAPRPPVMVGHLHLQAMGDTREQSRDGLLDSPDSGLPPSPSPSPPFYALSPGTLDARATTEPPGPNEAPAVRLGDRAAGGPCRSQHGLLPPEADVEWHRTHQDLQAGSFRVGAGGLEYRVMSWCPQSLPPAKGPVVALCPWVLILLRLLLPPALLTHARAAEFLKMQLSLKAPTGFVLWV